MSPMPTFRLLTGCCVSVMRGIGFLEGHKELDARSKFDGFGGSDERYFRASMDQWLDGANGPKTRFHNFKSDNEYRECFVFKCDEHRLYGFLCNPTDLYPRFQLCALCIYAAKYEHESDRAELKRVDEWRRSLGAKTAIAKVYPPKLPGRKSWKN
jgi:hypothetical protein